MRKLILLFLVLSSPVFAGTISWTVTDPNRPDLQAYVFVIQGVTDSNFLMKVDAQAGLTDYIIPNIPPGNYIVSANCICDDIDMGECFGKKPITVEDYPAPITVVMTVAGSVVQRIDHLADCAADSACVLYVDL